MSRRHINIKKELPAGWGEFEFELDLTSGNTINKNTYYIIPSFKTNATYTGGIIVDWGDGVIESFFNGGYKSHIYTTADIYTVKVQEYLNGNGDNQNRLYSFSFYNSSSSYVSKLIKWKSDQIGNMDGTFRNLINLIDLGDLIIECENVTVIQNLFSGCSSLVSVPKNIFSKLTLITSIYGVFQNCTALTNIESNIFSSMKLINCGYVFNNCTSLSSNINNIFGNDTDLSTLNVSQYAFYGCTNLTGSGNSFINKCTKPPATKSRTFTNCTNLIDYTTIPSGWK